MNYKSIFLKIDFGVQSAIFIAMLLFSIATSSGIPFMCLLIVIGIWQFSTNIFYTFFLMSNTRKYYFIVAVLTLIGFYLGGKDNWYNFLIRYEFLFIIPVCVSIWYYKITYEELASLK